MARFQMYQGHWQYMFNFGSALGSMLMAGWVSEYDLKELRKQHERSGGKQTELQECETGRGGAC